MNTVCGNRKQVPDASENYEFSYASSQHLVRMKKRSNGFTLSVEEQSGQRIVCLHVSRILTDVTVPADLVIYVFDEDLVIKGLFLDERHLGALCAKDCEECANAHSCESKEGCFGDLAALGGNEGLAPARHVSLNMNE